jgi:hypothetical protein
MRQTIIVAATTALITAIVAIWGTTVIIAHTQNGPDAALAAGSGDEAPLMQAISDAKSRADEKADPLD